MNKSTPQLLNASEAIAETLNRLSLGVVSAYPITPQTKIVEKLADLKAQGRGRYEFVRAESEFAAASVVLGAAAAGLRAYTATSSQGLLMMLEVLYNIAGLRLPVVITCANRSLSAPLNIWNDHSDVMAARDAGWLILFAENNQEAVDQHVLAYKLAEKLQLPVMVNVDGFILTHMSEAVNLPTPALIKKFLPALRASANRLNPAKPETLGQVVGPKYFYKFKRQQAETLQSSVKTINQEYATYQKIAGRRQTATSLIDNGLIEFYGPAKAKTVIVAMGSVVGTIKTAVDDFNSQALKLGKLAVVKIKTFRPWPTEALQAALAGKRVVVINKAGSAGALPPLSAEIAATLGKTKTELTHVIAGLGGQDITVKNILDLVKKRSPSSVLWLE